MKLFIALFFTSQAIFAAEGGIINERPDQVVKEIEMDKVVFVDHDLNRKKGSDIWVNISVDRSGITNTVGDYKKAWVVFRNHTDYDYVIEVRTLFFDANHIMTDDTTKWKRIYLPANSMTKHDESSIDLRTRYYRLEVRSAL